MNSLEFSTDQDARFHAPHLAPGLTLTGASIRRALADVTIYALLAILFMAGVVMAQGPTRPVEACVFALDMETGRSLSGSCHGQAGR